MKKLSTLILFFALTSVVFAQTNKVYRFTGVTGGATMDSTSNGASDTMVIHSQHYAETVSIQPVVTKASGTVNGTVIVQGSLDGVNYVSTYTLTMTNQTTNTGVYVVKDNPYSYWRAITVDTNAVSKKYIKVYFLPNMQSGLTVGTKTLKSRWGLTIDTVTNTATNYVSLQVQNWYQTVSIQAVVTKISGTAAGTVTLQGSNDGTNYVTVNTAYLNTGAPQYTTGAAATLAVTNVTTTTGIWVVKGSPYEYYRLSYTGSGTMACKLQGTMLPSK